MSFSVIQLTRVGIDLGNNVVSSILDGVGIVNSVVSVDTVDINNTTSTINDLESEGTSVLLTVHGSGQSVQSGTSRHALTRESTSGSIEIKTLRRLRIDRTASEFSNLGSDENFFVF